MPDNSVGDYGLRIAEATALYATQAAAGSQRGVLSLRMVAKELLAEPTRTAAAARDPLVARLLVAYALALLDDRAARRRDRSTTAPARGSTPAKASASSRTLSCRSCSTRSRRRGHRTSSERTASPPSPTAPASLDLAARATALRDTALSQWLRAKLAVRAGDLNAAATHYAAAARLFPTKPEVLDNSAGQLLSGERGVLSLARGEYQLALRFLLAGPTPYWADAAYVAERVLTTDELLHVVANANPRGGPIETTPETLANLERCLLARRLMREGQYREALPFFKDNLTRFQGEGLRRCPRAGRNALVPGEPRPRRLLRSGPRPPPPPRDDGPRGAARLRLLGRPARRGEWGGTASPARSSAPTRRRASQRAASARTCAGTTATSPSTTRSGPPTCCRRLAPSPFAAVLCWAGRWMQQTPESGERGPDLWRRYVRDGAVVPFAPTFGRECPEPAFDDIGHASRPEIFPEGPPARRLALTPTSHPGEDCGKSARPCAGSLGRRGPPR